VSARNRAAYNWHILRSIGEKLRDVFETDMSKPLPDRIEKLMSRFEEAERAASVRPAKTTNDDAVAPPAAPPA
jgi:hypothetical protein